MHGPFSKIFGGPGPPGLPRIDAPAFGDPANTAQTHGRVLLLTPRPMTAGHDEFA